MKKRTQDWITLILGIWLFFSPWIFGYNGMGFAWNSYLFGALMAVVSGFALNDQKVWEEWINVIIGFWIFISPWVLGMAAASIMWNHWIVGLLGFAMAVSGIRVAQRQTAR